MDGHEGRNPGSEEVDDSGVVVEGNVDVKGAFAVTSPVFLKPVIFGVSG